MKRWTKIDMAGLSAGVAQAVARDILRRLDSGETVLARSTGVRATDWTPVRLTTDPWRPRNPDGSNAPDPSPRRCYAVPSGTVSESGGGFYCEHSYLVQHQCGYPLEHYAAPGVID